MAIVDNQNDETVFDSNTCECRCWNDEREQTEWFIDIGLHICLLRLTWSSQQQVTMTVVYNDHESLG